MQIHELNNYNGSIDSAYFAADNGVDTGKVNGAQLFADVNDNIAQLETNLNARIDNIIAGGAAPSEAEIIDARLGANGINYGSLGTAIRTQVSYSQPIVISGKYVTGTGRIVNSEDRYITDYIPCTPGITVKYKGETNRSDISALSFFNDIKEPIELHKNDGALDTIYTAVAPAGASYVVLSWSTTAPGLIEIDGVIFSVLNNLEEKARALAEGVSNSVQDNELFYHKNLINPDDIVLGLRYSTGSPGEIVIDNLNYAGTGMIPVEEGEMYTFSGTAAVAVGGYFGEGAQMVNGQLSISDITFVNPVSGTGKMFVVPENQGVKYVSLVLNKANGAVNGTYQLERGEMATEIVPYDQVYIKPEYIPGGNPQQLSSFDTLPSPEYDTKLIAPISKFRDHWAKKDKDLMVVGTGTSLTARGAEHCTLRPDASSRPPLLDSNNFASAMWDLMKWEGQYYRRYDYGVFFTETGNFLSSHLLADWDDATYRDAWTRYSDGACSVEYTIPADAWQANFIYRTDTSGTQNATVSIAEGNGKMVVWDGSAWVEANGYTFSMRETPVILPSVSVPNPRGNEDNSNFTLTNYQVSGNTTFQKRLKMKAVSRDATKTITISSTSGRFMYWGVEWSVREFMITYVNSARGSHNMTVDSENALQKYQDNEIWSFKPDLIFTENPIHNSGGSGSSNGFSQYYSTYWRNVTYDFFFNTQTNPVSLMSRAIACGIDTNNLEWAIFNTSISINFGGIDSNGLLKIQPDKNGRMITALDAQMMSQDYITDSDLAVSINACKYWVDAAIKLFGDLKTATIGSGKDGDTFTNEGSHWNDTGCKVMARCIGGIFGFYN